MSHSKTFTTIPQRTTPAQTSAPADATGRFFSRSAGTGRRRHGRGAAPVLDRKYTGGAQAGDLRLSHARRSQTGEIGSFAFEKSCVGPFGTILACLSFYVRRSRPTYFVDGSTQTVWPCRHPFGKPSLADELFISRCGCRRGNRECTQTGKFFLYDCRNGWER